MNKHNNNQKLKIARVSHVDFPAYAIEHMIRLTGATSHCLKRHVNLSMRKASYSAENMKSMSKFDSSYFPLGMLILKSYFAVTRYNAKATQKTEIDIAEKDSIFNYSKYALILRPQMINDELVAICNDTHITFQNIAKEIEQRLNGLRTSADCLINDKYFPFRIEVCPKYYFFEYCKGASDGKCSKIHKCIKCNAKHTFANCPQVAHEDMWMKQRIGRMNAYNRRGRRPNRGRGRNFFRRNANNNAVNQQTGSNSSNH